MSAVHESASILDKGVCWSALIVGVTPLMELSLDVDTASMGSDLTFDVSVSYFKGGVLFDSGGSGWFYFCVIFMVPLGFLWCRWVFDGAAGIMMMIF